MSTELDGKLEVDRELIKNAVRLQLPIEITTYTLPRNMEIYIRSILTTFLEECHQEHLEEYLQFCLGELLTNAKKANTKRVYFKENGLDINNPEDYEKGMEHFKEDTLTNIDHYLELQKKDGLYIKLDLQLRGDKVKIEIRNKAKLTVFERERIQSKMDNVQKYNNMEQVFTNVIDQTEGAGLGIIIIILMLQKVGLAKENYQVECDGEETVTRIILPCNKEIFSAEEMMTYEFVNLQNTIPVISSHYDNLQKVFSKTDYSKQEVYEIIRDNSTLSLLLLSEATKKKPKCVGIKEAFELFTDEEIKAIYPAENSKLHLIESTPEKEALWDHSRRTAFFAFNLLKNTPGLMETYTEDQIYTAALLNRLSYILLSCATEEQYKYIKELSEQYEESDKICDIFWNGNAQSFMNLIYTKRIGLSDELSCVVSTWNYWEMAPDNLLNAIYIVYLAELFQYYKEGRVDFYQIDKKVLDFFDITNESQLFTLVNKLSQGLEG